MVKFRFLLFALISVAETKYQKTSLSNLYNRKTVVNKCCDVGEILNPLNATCSKTDDGYNSKKLALATKHLFHQRLRHSDIEFKTEMINCEYEQGLVSGKYKLLSNGSLYDVMGESVDTQQSYCIDNTTGTEGVNIWLCDQSTTKLQACLNNVSLCIQVRY